MFRIAPLNTYIINNRPQIPNDVTRHYDMNLRLQKSMKILNTLEHPSLLKCTNENKIFSPLDLICEKVFAKSNITVSPSKVLQVLQSERLKKEDYKIWTEEIWTKLVQSCTAKSRVDFRIQNSQSRQISLELKILIGEFHLYSQTIVERNSGTLLGRYFYLPKDSLHFDWKKEKGKMFIRLIDFDINDKQLSKTKFIVEVNDHVESARILGGEIIKTSDTLLDEKLILFLNLVNEKSGETVPFPSTFHIAFSVFK